MRFHLEAKQEPNFLYTSGKPNRYNPEGVNCIYWSECLEAAVTEYQTTTLLGVPFTVFAADAEMAILDLSDSSVLSALGLTASDLHEPWREVASATLTQTLGRAVSMQSRFAGIRYPSNAALSQGGSGQWNWVIFPDSMESSSATLKVVLEDELEEQMWPKGTLKRPV